MRKATKFQPTVKDVSEVTAKLQKGGHSDLIPVFLGQDATLTKGGRVSTKKGVNERFDPSRTAYRKGFNIDDFITELVGLGTSVGQAAIYPVDLALQANIEKHKAKELKPKFKPKDDRKHIADRLRKNAEKVLGNQFLGSDPETKAEIIEAMRDAGLQVSDEGRVSIPRTLSEEQLRKIEKEEVVPKPKQFRRRYEEDAKEFFDNLKDDYYEALDKFRTDWEFYGYGKNFEKQMSHIGYLLRHGGASAAMADMLELKNGLYVTGRGKSDLEESDLYDRF